MNKVSVYSNYFKIDVKGKIYRYKLTLDKGTVNENFK